MKKKINTTSRFNRVFLFLALFLFFFNISFGKIFKKNLYTHIDPIIALDLFIAPIEPNAICTELSNTQIGGTVFEDWNYDGLMNQSDTIGVQDVKVYIHNDFNNVIDSVYTDSNGNYQFDNLMTGTTYRIQFSLPESISRWAKVTSAGADNGTSVQFVQPGNCASLGVASPSDYCQENPLIGLPCYVSGDPTASGTSATTDWWAGFRYNNAGEIGEASYIEPELKVNGAAIGTTWGSAYHRQTQHFLLAATMKRHSGFGANGTGAIYKIDEAGTPSLFVDLNTLPGIDAGTDTRDGSPNNILPADSDDLSRDINAFQAVGKVGFGDIDLSDDGQSLYAINLSQRTLIEMSVGDNLTTPTTATVYDVAGEIEALLSNTPIACGTSSDYRPWALKFHKGMLYIGVVCSAETSQAASDLHAYVLSFDPANTANGFSLVLDMAMDYDREPAFQSDVAAQTILGDWRAWALNFADATILPWNGAAHPSPILTDIEVDVDGSFILGFMDRFGMQSGYQQFQTDLSDSDNDYQGLGAGDVIRFCNVNGVLLREGSAGCPTNMSPSWTDPGNFVPQNEYYASDEFFTNITSPAHGHPEISMGNLALLKGTGEVIAGIIDPFVLRSGGVAWWNNVDGSTTKKYELYESLEQATPDGTFSKAVGLGDIEVKCDLAPIEIGNYVWEDVDNDGIQDAAENPLEGVIITLYDAGCKVCARDTTDVFGQYYFNDAKLKEYIAAPTDTVLTANSTYHIVITGTTAGGWNIGTSQLTLNGAEYNLTMANQGTNDAIDNDGTVGMVCGGLTNYPFITVQTQSAGCMNHDADFGLTNISCIPQTCFPVKATKKTN